MTGRELGCKLTMLLLGAGCIFGFFGCLMNVADTGLRAATIRRQQNDTRYDFQILFTGLRQYAEANGGKLPPMDSPQAAHTALFSRYVGFEDAFTRFGDGALHLPNPALSNKLLAKLPPETILYTEADPKPTTGEGAPPDTRAVLLVSGEVQHLSLEDWQKRGW